MADLMTDPSEAARLARVVLQLQDVDHADRIAHLVADQRPSFATLLAACSLLLAEAAATCPEPDGVGPVVARLVEELRHAMARPLPARPHSQAGHA